MDFTVLIVGLLIGVGIPLRNKVSKNIGKNGTGTTILRTKRGTKMNKILLLEDDLSLINGLTFAF